uniref:LAGLIDADG endonuclease n=1 Tax=Scytalidium sp. TaxID=1715249 RepID=A0A513U0R6_9PEZI|nr:LAGLIDADG endonuclease [Scytalidium sp.]
MKKEDKTSNQIKNSSLIVKSNNKSIKLDQNFIHWLVGFTDAEGNFNISLKGLKNNTYNSLILTYQIDLHIDDLQVLEYIKNKLNCGSISKSGDKCNYFVNDQKSLINVILPLFNYMELKSSKYFQYLIFEKAVKMLINKEHLTPKGRLNILEYYKEIKIVNMNTTAREYMEINEYWLIGFTEGDATFSTNKLVPRLKFENHIKELNLFKSILNFFKRGNLSESKRNTGESVILEINNIHVLFNTVLPLYTKFMLTKKSLDFVDWSNIVKIYYYGYHTLSEGIELINLIKSQMNNYRLSSNSAIKIDQNIILEKLNYIFSLPSPYEIKNNIRFIRGTDKLVSEKLNIIVEDINGNIQYFNSIWDCSLQINISRKIIKNCLITGRPYKDYTFKFDTYIK